MKDKTLLSEQNITLEMPHIRSFVCYDDDEITLISKICWEDNTPVVKSCELKLLNLSTEKRYNLIGLNKSEENDQYSVILIQDEKADDICKAFSTSLKGVNFSTIKEIHFTFFIYQEIHSSNNQDEFFLDPIQKDGFLIKAH